MDCSIAQPIVFGDMPKYFSTYMNPWESTLATKLSELEGEVIEVLLSCVASAPASFTMFATLGDATRGFPPCPTDSAGNVSVTLPIPNIPDPFLVLTVNGEATTNTEYCTIFSSAIQSCSHKDEDGFIGWVLALICIFSALAIFSVVLYCRKKHAYSLIV
jgi:hypothetical protein